MDYEIVYNENSVLGEGPIWDEKTQRLFWIDGLGQKVHIFNPASSENISFDIPQPIGSIALTNDDNIVVMALQDGIYTLDTNTGALESYLTLEDDLPGNRFNDGKCDSMGRFWFGSMNTAANSGDAGCAATGSVYCLSADKKIIKVLSGVTISNGMAWNMNKRRFYYIDSPSKSVFAFDFEPENGTLASRRVVVDLTEKENELPDGMTIDSDGMLWIAIWGGYRVCRFNPEDGKCMAEIRFPVKNITSCEFGGENLDELYVTSSNLDAKETEKEYAGALFRVKTRVSGIYTNRFISHKS